MRQKLGMIFGAQYYRPPFPDDSCWERDFRNMKELGFNTVKLWAVWNAIELEPGVYTFTDLDRLMDLAKEHQLRAVINIIPEGAPYFTQEGHEDALYQTAQGYKVTYGGPANLPTAGWPGLCLDDPTAAKLVTNFIRATTAHFANHPALLAFDVWNEPHLEPMFDYRDQLLCYCKHSVQAFREWLLERYGSVEGINRAWFRHYRITEEVSPPPRFGTGVDMVDWRLFWLYNLQRHMRLRVRAAREGAPDALIQSHVACSGYVGTNGRGGLANELGDEFLLSREVDVFGLTCFPNWLMKDDPLFNHLLNNEIIAAAAGEKPFYQVELQGGGGKAGWLGGVAPSGEDVRCWNYLSVAAGGKGVTYWQYAPEPAGMESPGFGLTGFQGQNTERSLAAGICAQELNRHDLAMSHRVTAQNAIYLSRTTSLWFFAAGREEARYAAAIHGVYRLFYEHNIPVTFAHADNVRTLYADGIRVLFLPAAITLSAEEIDALETFVRAGGTLISEACPGLYNEKGVLDQDGNALYRLFGLQHVELQAISGEIPIVKNSKLLFTGEEYRQLVRPCRQLRILGIYSDGETACTDRKIGNGHAIWIGSFIFAPRRQGWDAQAARALLSYVVPTGYPQLANWKCSSQGVVMRLLHSDAHGDKMVIVNTSAEMAAIQYQVSNSDAEMVNLCVEPKECLVRDL